MLPDLTVARIRRLWSRCATAGLAAALMATMLAVPAFAQGVLRIAAVVNEDVISAYDLANRMRLVLVTSNVPDTPEIRQRLASQVLRNMIDERLQLQEARRLNIEVTEEELDNLLVELNKQNGLPPGSIEQMLAQNNIDINVLRLKLRAEQAWYKVVTRSLQHEIFIGNEEIDEELNRLKTMSDQPRHRVAEIFLPIDNPDNEARIRDLAERLLQQIVAGANFAALAREFSQSTSAAAGGEVGWVTQGRFDPELDRVIATARPLEPVGPIRTLSGYYILVVIDRVIPGDPASTTTVDLAQLLLPLDEHASPKEVQSLAATALQIRSAVSSCTELRQLARTNNITTTNELSGVPIGQMPSPMRSAIAALQVGQTTEPIRVTEGLLLITLCGRKEDANALPSREEIRQRLLDERVDLLIQRYMRDLRRTAFVDIRG